jgi:hypothetical protein
MSAPAPAGSPLPGDPEQARRVSAQLAAVELRTREIESRLRAIETGVGPQVWRGRAADGFAALLAATGPDLTALATSYGAASQALATYATELAAAQDVARAAEAEAAAATGDRDRAAADRDTAEADAVRYATAADEARLRLDPVAAQDADQRRTDALGRAAAAGAAVGRAEQAQRAAQQKADEAADRRATAAARCIRELDEASSGGIDSRNLAQGAASNGPRTATADVSQSLGGFGAGAVGFGANVVNDAWDKRSFNAADLTSGVVGGYYGLHRNVLARQAQFKEAEARRLRASYLEAPGGSAFARGLTQSEFAAANQAAELRARVARMGGVRGNIIAGKLPVVGLAITLLGVGSDVRNGKPAGKAIVSGLGGFGAGIAFGMMVSGPVGWVALGGVAASAVAGVGADVVYDSLPEGVRDAVEAGVNATVDGAEALWDALF